MELAIVAALGDRLRWDLGVILLFSYTTFECSSVTNALISWMGEVLSNVGVLSGAVAIPLWKLRS